MAVSLVVSSSCSCSSLLLLLLLLQCGDVEPNPGPMKVRPDSREPKPDKAKIMADKVEGHDGKIAEMGEAMERMLAKQVELERRLEEREVENARRAEEIKVELASAQRENKVLLEREVGGVSDMQASQEKLIGDLQREIQQLRNRLSGVDNLDTKSEDTSARVKELEEEVDEILEKLWELDKSWRNNLVFYGIRGTTESDQESTTATESKIKDIISKTMGISREIPILRVRRSFNGPEVRGSRPVTVYFERWQDKDEILRKGKMLRGSNVFVSEEFSKRVRDHRTELQKFAKLEKKRRPAARFNLQYDKLFVDKEVYVFNELSGKIELLGSEMSETMSATAASANSNNSNHNSINAALVRKKSSGRRRLQKSYSTESSLHQMSEGSQLYAPDSPKKSPTRRITPTTGRQQQHQNGNDQQHQQHQQQQQQQQQHVARKDQHRAAAKEVEEDEEEEEEDGLVDYTEVGGSASMSPIRRMNAIIPETIPE